MERSTDSRRARNSDSVTIGGRRRPVSRPSRRRCFLASSLVDPLTDRTSSLPFGSRTCTTVSGGSSEVSESDPAAPSAEPRRRLRRRLRALLPADSVSSSAEPPASARRRRRPPDLTPRPGLRRRRRPWPCWCLVRRLRVREDDRLVPCGSGWPPSAVSGWPSWVPSPPWALWGSGWPSPASAAASWSPFLPRPRLGRRLRRRPGPVPSSSSPELPAPVGASRCSRCSRRGPGVTSGAGPGGPGEPAAWDGGAGSGRAGAGRAAGGWNTTCGGWNTAAGTAGFSSPASRPLAGLSLNSLSYSSLSSIRAISSQAPGRAVPRRSAHWRRSATHPHTAREHVVNEGPGGAALAVLGPRGYRASPTAPSLVTYLCLVGYGSLAPPHRRHDPFSRPAGLPASRARGPCASRVVMGGDDGTMPACSRSAVKTSSGRTAGAVCRTTIRRMAQSSWPVAAARWPPSGSAVVGPISTRSSDTFISTTAARASSRRTPLSVRRSTGASPRARKPATARCAAAGPTPGRTTRHSDASRWPKPPDGDAPEPADGFPSSFRDVDHINPIRQCRVQPLAHLRLSLPGGQREAQVLSLARHTGRSTARIGNLRMRREPGRISNRQTLPCALPARKRAPRPCGWQNASFHA